jgi:hypothetical protein
MILERMTTRKRLQPDAVLRKIANQLADASLVHGNLTGAAG